MIAVDQETSPSLKPLNRLQQLLRQAWGKARVRQTAALYGSEIALIVLTFGTGILNSRFLGATHYGVYSFVVTVVEVVMIFSGFGVSQSGARVVALAKDPEKERSVHGALIVIALVMGACMSVTLILLTPTIELIFKTGQTESLKVAALICFTTPLQLIMMQACRGGNKIGVLASLKILPKALYLIGGLAMIYWTTLTATAALSLYFFGGLLTCVIAMFSLRVRFKSVREHARTIFEEVKRYGFHSFLGGIADNSTFKLNTLLIAGYVSTTWLGFYSIASTLVSPMVSFSVSLSTAVYRSLTTKDSLDRRVFILNGAFLIVCGSCIALFVKPLISLVLTDQFLPAAGLVYILLFTAFFQGMYQPINAFLGAHGKGKELRNISFVVCIVNLCVAFALLPKFGAYGAALGSALAKFCEFLGNVHYYRKVTRQIAATRSPA